MPDNKPIEQGELAESPNSHFDHRSRNLTDAAIRSRAFLIYDIRLGNSRPVCVRALHIHLKNLTLIDLRHETSSTLRFPTKDIKAPPPWVTLTSPPWVTYSWTWLLHQKACLGPMVCIPQARRKNVGKLFLAVPPQGKVALSLLHTYICLFLAMTMTIAESWTLNIETLITFLTLENNNLNIHCHPSIKSDTGQHS